jgi:hypothetical protein
VRYGGFAARYCLSSDGQVVPAIADDTGTLVPDRRDPVFQVLPPLRTESPWYLRAGIYDVTVLRGTEVIAEFRGRSRTVSS